MAGPIITSAILCEDIRHELGNKNSLIGVFSGNILVAELPAKIRLAVYYEAKLDKPQKIVSEMRFQFADAAALIGTMEQEVQTAFMSSATPTFELTLDKEGDFVVSVKFDNNDWQEIIRKTVTLDKSIATSSSVP